MLRHLLPLICLGVMIGRVWGLEPIPDKLVVLTFDDASKSHFTVARPLLKKYGFGATFFITLGLHYRSDQGDGPVGSHLVVSKSLLLIKRLMATAMSEGGPLP